MKDAVDSLVDCIEKKISHKFRSIENILSGKNLEEYQAKGELCSPGKMEGASVKEIANRALDREFLKQYGLLNPKEYSEEINITMDMYTALCSWVKRPADTFDNILRRRVDSFNIHAM